MLFLKLTKLANGSQISIRVGLCLDSHTLSNLSESMFYVPGDGTGGASVSWNRLKKNLTAIVATYAYMCVYLCIPACQHSGYGTKCMRVSE